MKIKYHSTRGGDEGVDFKTMLLSGYANDGGMLLPETFPSLSKDEIKEWANLAYEELAFKIISLFVDEEEIPSNDLKDLLHRSFSVFTVPEVVPIKKLADGLVISELFNGPSLAFKDLAMSCLGNFFDYFLKKDKKNITLIVCTSGDTGSSAIEAVKNSSNIDIIVILPRGFCTTIQELQMTTVVQPNVHVFRVDGSSDEGDVVTRKLFADPQFVAEHNLGSSSSLNFTRLLVQIVHFFYTYLKLCPAVDKEVEMILPTGGCGNLASGYVAKKMGLPVTFTCAVNNNNVLSRIMETGQSELGEVKKTLSPAMDIQFAYNLERIWYFCSNGDSDAIKKIMGHVDSNQQVIVPNDIMDSLRSEVKVYTVAGDEAVKETMCRCWKENQYHICPHTAVGVAYYYSTLKDGDNERKASAILATASPLKFPEAAQSAGIPVPTSDKIASLMTAATHYTDLEKDQDWYLELKKVIEKITTRRASK